MNREIIPKLKVIIGESVKEAREMSDVEVRPEHIISSIINDNNNGCVEALRLMGIDLLRLNDSMYLELTNNNNLTPRVKKVSIPFSKETKTIFNNVDSESELVGDNHIDTTHVMLAILNPTNKISVVKILNKTYGIDYNNFIKIVKNMKNELGSIRNSSDDDEFDNNQNGDKKDKKFKKTTPSKTPVLDNFCDDISKLADENKIDPVIGRDKEIKRVTQILSRRKKQNPILIGDAGCGKTSIAEGIALLIKSGLAPRNLINKRIYSIDLASVVAGTKYRGQFEERIKGILDELKQNRDIILFIDEFHTFVGAGNTSGSLDASNIFKPALARGEIQVIGATTLDEFREHIEKDAALTRRFQQVLVEPTTIEETKMILNNIKEKYETHHKVKYTDEAIEECVKMADRYITDRAMPDKAIDILDEAGASTNTALERPENIKLLEKKKEGILKRKLEVIQKQKYEEAAELRDEEKKINEDLDKAQKKWLESIDKKITTVDVDIIAETISMMTGIPVSKISSQENKRLMNLDKSLTGKVIGQDEAVLKVVKAIKRSRLGIRNTNKPISSFIFLGNSGTGKTLLTKMLAKEVFGDSDALIRVDMSEYMEKHSISKLVGCFTPETLISMSDGKLKPIIDIEIGESVITHNGNIKKVIDKYQYKNNGLIDSYKIANTNITLDCTKQHEIFAIKPYYINNRIDKTSYDINNAKFYHSHELKVGDILMYPKKINSGENNDIIIDLADYCKLLSKYKTNDDYVWCYETMKFNRKIKVNEKFLRFIGYYLSEGGVKKTMKETKFTFNIKETEYVNELCELITEIFGDDINPVITEIPEKNSVKVTISSKVIGVMLSELFGRTKYEKKLPEWIMKINPTYVINLFETLIYGDGCKTQNRKMVYKTVSRDLATQMNTIFKKIGYSTQFNLIKKEKPYSDIYHIILTGLNIVKLNTEFPNLRILDFNVKPKNIQRLQHQDDNYFYYQITDKIEKEYNGLVYDLSVEDDSSYIANNVGVHNSPPGYVGFEQGGQLTEKVRRKPYSVILFDEIEKAHEDVFNILLQVLDEGHLTDGLGRKINFKNCLIILTSNVGAKELSSFSSPMGFQTESVNINEEERTKSIIEKALKKKFKPEFLNRLDEIVVFNKLKEEDIHKIIYNELDKLKVRIKEIGYELKIQKSAIEFVAKNGYNEEYGARPLNRAIQRYIEDTIADEILNGKYKEGDTINITFDKTKNQIILK
jgi:ATP-dependent Clp protease ATP-binding subunit ClpC